MADKAFDAIVIGSGPGGSSAAYALTRAGLSVLLIEAGPSYDPFIDYDLHSNSWETNQFNSKVETQERQTYANLQPLLRRWDHLRSWSAVEGQLNQDIDRRVWGYSHVVGYGGTSLHYTGEAHRMHPDAMRMHTQFEVSADWPITYEQLEPYYVKAERLLGVAGPDASGSRWRSAPLPLPAHKSNFASQHILKSAKQTGLSWEANTLAVLSQAYDNRPACNYCSNCNRGCPRTDKGSMDVTFLRSAASTGNLEVLLNATVLRLVQNSNDQVSGVEVATDADNVSLLNARVVVVACGAIETPRLLLNSHNTNSPNGLANESGLVGKNFMETVSWSTTGLHPEPLGSHRGLPADMMSWTYNAPDAIENVIGGCRFTTGCGEADLLGPINYAQRLIPGWGRSHKKTMREYVGNALGVHAIGENLANARSFIDLDPQEIDDNGMPKARIHSYLPDSELHRLNFMREKCREAVLAAGCDKIVEEYGAYDFFSSTHVFGTCRMGIDPKDSVVNEYGQAHQWKNLYITDASVFPSSGGGEAPTLTILALGLRSSENIVTRMNSKEL